MDNTQMIKCLSLGMVVYVILSQARVADNTTALAIGAFLAMCYYKGDNLCKMIPKIEPYSNSGPACNGLPGGVVASDRPGYFLLNNGSYSNDGLSYDTIADAIDNSKMHDILHQHTAKSVTMDHLKELYMGTDRMPLYYDIPYSDHDAHYKHL